MKKILLALSTALGLAALAGCSGAGTKASAPEQKPLAQPGPETEAVLRSARPSPLNGPCEALAGRPLAQGFAGFDANADGSVSRDEFLCQALPHFSALNADHSSFLEGEELRKLPTWLAVKKKGATLSAVEFMKRAEAAFQRADRNGNGGLSAAEFKTGKL